MAEATIGINITGNTASINAALNRLSGQLKRTASGSDNTSKKIRAMGASMNSIRTSLTGMTAGFFSAYGAIRLIGISTDILAQFDHSMARVAAVTQATENQFNDLRESAIELGRSTVFTQNEVAQGQQFLAMAGMNTNEILNSQEAVLELAQVGMIGLGRAADIATNIMTSFGISADHSGAVVDDLVTTITRSNTNMTQLGDAIKYVGPIASGAGIPLRDVAAAIGTLSDAGLQGSMAGTGLRMVLMRLQSPTKETADALARIGLTTEEVNPAIHGMDAVLQRLSESFGVSGEASKIFGIRQAAAGTVLVENVEKFRELNKELKDNEGASKKASDRMRSSLLSSFKLVKSAFAGLIQALGDAGLTVFLQEMALELQKIAKGAIVMVKNMGGAENVFKKILFILKALVGTAVIFVGIWGARKFQAVLMATWSLSSKFFASFVMGAKASAMSVGIMTGAVRGLSIAIKGLLASTIVLAVFVAIGAGIELLVNKMSDKGDELEDISKSMQEQVESTQKQIDDLDKKTKELLGEENTPDNVADRGTKAQTAVLTEQMEAYEELDSLRAKFVQETENLAQLEAANLRLYGAQKKEHGELVEFSRRRVSLLTQQLEAEQNDNAILKEVLEKKAELVDLEEKAHRHSKDRSMMDIKEKAQQEHAAAVEKKALQQKKILEQELADLKRKQRIEQEKLNKAAVEQANAAIRSMEGNERDFEITKLKALAGEKDRFGRKTGRAKKAEKALHAAEDEKAVEEIVNKFAKSLKGMGEGAMDGPANEFLIEKRRQEAMAVVAKDRANKDKQSIGLGLGGVSSLAKIGGGGGVAGDLELQANALRERAAIAAEKQLDKMNAMNHMQQGILEALRGNGDSPTFGLTRA